MDGRWFFSHCVVPSLPLLSTVLSSVTLHSWIALASAALLTMQLVGGLLFYLFPIFPFSLRVRALPLHGQYRRS
jgi:hypothetical protein